MSATQNLINQLGRTGLEAPLDELEQQFADNVHRFASDVMRPIGLELDRMSPEDAIAAGSPYWQVWQEFAQLGISIETLYELDMPQRARFLALLLEELTWGDGGLAISLSASLTPKNLAFHFQNEFILNNVPDDAIGCWGITEPDHGSDMLNVQGLLSHPAGSESRANCVAKIRDKEVVISGQKSAWVSNGPVAQYAALFCAADRGNDADERVVVIVPLDAKGVSRGKPLDKLGQRPLPQGEIFFDNVSISTDWLLAPVEMYPQVLYAQLAEANGGMGVMWAGMARAAFELALDYAHTRKQGGVPIFHHQNVKRNLLHMFRQVEAARALARRNLEYNLTHDVPALVGSISSKITSTQAAFDVASAALQMFGGNGLTKEYPIEKLLRDARASMIEDGCNEVLSIVGGGLLGDPEQL